MWANRANQTYRPYRPLTSEEEKQHLNTLLGLHAVLHSSVLPILVPEIQPGDILFYIHHL